MPRTLVPDEVLAAVAETPEMWPTILEMAHWHKDERTGTIEVDVFDGAGIELRRVERLKLGKALGLPPGALAVCPVCSKSGLAERDYGNRYFCDVCDILWTVWDLKRRKAFVVPQREPGERA